MIKLYTDAATKGNPGPTGLGILIVTPQQTLQEKQTLVQATNHQGEFAAAIAGFRLVQQHFTGDDTVLFYTDSRLVSDAIGKNYAKHYDSELQQLTQLFEYFNFVVTKWVPEKENMGAHQLANQALHSIE